jgi:hypothetical protein
MKYAKRGGVTSDGVMLIEYAHHESKPNCCPRFWEEVTEINVHKWAGRRVIPGPHMCKQGWLLLPGYLNVHPPGPFS